jgi:cyclic pyranopterin phosphate synthase
MANILITNHCLRNCTFCFARSRLGQGQKVEEAMFMSRADLRKIMDFLGRSGERNLRLLGGEPTLHPEFIEMVSEALERDFHVHLFTNAMMPKAVADFLGDLPQERISLLCNVSPQAKVSAAEQEKVHYALSRLGQRAQVGITLTSPDFQYDFLLDYIQQYNLRKRIRIGIAQPIVGTENAYLQTADYREAGRSIVAMAQECIKKDILIGFDCGMTLCMFSTEEIGILATCSEGFNAVCQPIVDVGPNLEIWHCFPLSEVLNSRLENFVNRTEIGRFYQKKVSRYKTFGCMDKCLTCPYLRRGQCTGGCLAHAMNALNKKPPREA